MPLLPDLVALVDGVRTSVSQAEGLRAHTIRLIRRTWTGTRPGDGTATDTVLVLTDPVPRVNQPTGRTVDEQRRLRGDVDITHISRTQTHETLTGEPLAANERFYWAITDARTVGGVDGVERLYRVLGAPTADAPKSFQWRVRLRAVRPLNAQAVSLSLTTPAAYVYDRTAGTVASGATPEAVTGWTEGSARAEFGIQGREGQRTQRIHVLMDDLPTRPTPNSRAVVDGVDGRVVRVDADADGLYWVLSVEVGT